MNRECKPELLDSLPHDHPDALHNRRDLRLINRAMGNRAWFERVLPTLVRKGERVLEIGAGTGEMGMALNRRGIAVDGLDLWPRPADWPAGREWHRADLKTFDGYDRYPVIIGNLILHQFSDVDLAALGERIRKSARMILACEPVRSRTSKALFAMVAPVFGANHVTLHDARVSIVAGFRGNELPDVLGLDPVKWRISCTTTALGALRMVAIGTP